MPGCLVSFEDYPLGDLDGAAQGEAGAGGSETPAAVGGSAAGEAPSLEGGAAAEGGAPATSAEVSALDDFEHEDSTILELDGRKGDWYVSNDGRGVQTPPAGADLLPTPLERARGGSTHALHTSGGPFFSWGALVGASFSSGERYDLSGYRGIRMWVRSSPSAMMGPGAAKQVRLNLTTTATSAGGPCTVCNDHFGADIPLSSQWVLVDLPLKSLKQVGFGRPQLEQDLSAVVDLQLTFPANVAFDLWVDDVELYR